MDPVSAEIWRGAPVLVEALKGIASKPKAEARKELLKALGVSNGEKLSPSKLPNTEDFEMALQVVTLELLETQDTKNAAAVLTLLDSAIYIGEELFRSAGSADMDICKSWWTLLINAAEDVCKLLPTEHIEQLVEDFKSSLVSLKTAHIDFAHRRLAEFDAQKELAEKEKEKERQKKEEEDKNKDEKGEKDKDKENEKEKEKSNTEAKAKLTDKRVEERKALITKLGISPNGMLHLNLTAVLKQLTNRLCNSIHAPLRAKIALLLEKLLPVDHKAIANNQKLRTTDFIQAKDLDQEEDVKEVFEKPAEEAVEVDKEEDPAPAAEEKKEKKEPSILDDPAVTFNLYRSFWSLQENLQSPERVFDTRGSWKQFLDSASAMISLFLKYPVRATGPQAWTPPESAALRFAPKAKAFSMQLEDPGFRLFVVSQLLIAFQTIEQDTPAKKSFASTLREQESTKKELAKLKTDCEKVAAATKQEYPEVLKHLMEREAHFTAWKTNACKEFKRESLEMLHAVAAPADQLSDPSIDLLPPKRDVKTTSALLETLRNPGWSAGVPKDDDAEVIRMVQMRKRCHEYLDRLLTEDDPAEGIEEDYKVKGNKVYMWQAKRLFCQQHLRRYAGDASAKTGFMTLAAQALGRKEFPKEGNGSDDKKLDPELEVAEPEEVNPDSSSPVANEEAKPGEQGEATADDSDKTKNSAEVEKEASKDSSGNEGAATKAADEEQEKQKEKEQKKEQKKEQEKEQEKDQKKEQASQKKEQKKKEKEEKQEEKKQQDSSKEEKVKAKAKNKEEKTAKKDEQQASPTSGDGASGAKRSSPSTTKDGETAKASSKEAEPSAKRAKASTTTSTSATMSSKSGSNASGAAAASAVNAAAAAAAASAAGSSSGKRAGKEANAPPAKKSRS